MAGGICGLGGDFPNTFLNFGDIPDAVLEVAGDRDVFRQGLSGNIDDLMFGHVATGKHGVLVIGERLALARNGSEGGENNHQGAFVHIDESNTGVGESCAG